jgi:hypothetical protein
MRALLARMAAERLAGGSPSLPMALVASAAAGCATAVVTFRLLRATH